MQISTTYVAEITNIKEVYKTHSCKGMEIGTTARQLVFLEHTTNWSNHRQDVCESIAPTYKAGQTILRLHNVFTVYKLSHRYKEWLTRLLCTKTTAHNAHQFSCHSYKQYLYHGMYTFVNYKRNFTCLNDWSLIRRATPEKARRL